MKHYTIPLYLWWNHNKHNIIDIPQEDVIQINTEQKPLVSALNKYRAEVLTALISNPYLLDLKGEALKSYFLWVHTRYDEQLQSVLLQANELAKKNNDYEYLAFSLHDAVEFYIYQQKLLLKNILEYNPILNEY